MMIYQFRASRGLGWALSSDKDGKNLPADRQWFFVKKIDFNRYRAPPSGGSYAQLTAEIKKNGYALANDRVKVGPIKA